MAIPVNRSVSKGMRNTEHLWSYQMVKIIETGCIENSDRVACSTINTLLHREGEQQTLKLRTMADLCDRHGKEVEAYQQNWTDEILARTGFDAESGLLMADAVLPESILRPKAKEPDARIAEIVKEINEKREELDKIPNNSSKPFDVECPDDSIVEISLDGVLAKRQREHREKDRLHREDASAQESQSKKRPSVETSVAHIQVNGKRYILTAGDMRSLCTHVLAFLFSTGLIENRQLLFFSDGAAEIKTCVDEIFAFCQHYIVLDWFHLRKHCYEILSMTLKSGKANRNMQRQVRRQLLRILWTGNVQGAISYLSNLPTAYIKSEDKRQELIRYLERKEPVVACYAVRKRLGLRISSNPVEKANDLTVARRQKHKGMSWSRHGSRHLASLSALYLNQEADLWHKSGFLSFHMLPVFSSHSASLNA